MIEAPFPVQDSTLSADALAFELKNRYSLPGRPQCRFHRKGICDTYRVLADRGKYFLKVYRNGRRSYPDVAEEVRLLLHLTSDGVSVAEPVPRSDSEYVGRIGAPEGERFYVLYHAAEGEQDNGEDPARIKAFGRIVARMHESSDAFPMPYQRARLDIAHLVDENLKVIVPLMAHRPSDVAVIEAVASHCRQLSILNDETSPVVGICHGDLHGGDVSFDTDREARLYDFDRSGTGFRALDIGVFPASVEWMNTSPEIEAKRARHLDTFLEGYSCVRRLNDEELHAVSFTAPIRHIYLMGFVLRYTAYTQGDHWADESFFDWHMRWFRWWNNTHETA